MANTKLISWNVNGIRAALKKGLYDKMKELNADVYCLQETKATTDIVKEIADGIDNYYCYANEAEKKGYSGTAIFTKTEAVNITYDIGVEEHDNEGRVVTVEFSDYYLVNVYVPNSGQGLKRLDYRKIWDEAFLNFLKGLAGKKPVILTGDLNVAHEAIDLARPQQNYDKTAGYTQVEIDGFKNMLDEQFIDTFRHLHPEEVAYTFWNQRFGARERNVGWRIDYFMVSKVFIDKVVSSAVLNEVLGSDHCPIELIIKS